MSGLPVLLFLDVSGGELIVILLVVFLVFGPDKMPEMARKAGRMMNQMKKATNDLTREFKKETAGLENEIHAVKNQVNKQMESVSREINSTRNSLNKQMSMETPTPAPADAVAAKDEETASPPASTPIPEVKSTQPPE
jgi:sec-independent protein translocase protein TatA